MAFALQTTFSTALVAKANNVITPPIPVVSDHSCRWRSRKRVPPHGRGGVAGMQGKVGGCDFKLKNSPSWEHYSCDLHWIEVVGTRTRT
eukprot:1056963-Prorocentrum_minimum.AAC.1